MIMFNVEKQNDDDTSENYDTDTALDIMDSAGVNSLSSESGHWTRTKTDR